MFSIIPSNQQIKFSFISNLNNKIEIQLECYSSEIIFTANYIDNIHSKTFLLKQSLEELMKNNYLKTGEDINGIFQIIKFFLEKNTPKLIEESNILKLIIPIEHPKIKEIHFILIEEKKEINSQMLELSNRIYNNLLKKINDLENKNEEKDKRIKILEEKIELNQLNIKKIEENDKRIRKLEEELKKIKEKLYQIKKFDSKIDFDEELVKLWLNNREFTAELLFRKTRDGSNPNDFHNKCDNKGITITFIETTKGYKFGGYTELQWDNCSGGKIDKSTFLFSFNYCQKYHARNNKFCICCASNYCPWFGNDCYPEIYFNCSLNKGQSYDSLSNNTFVSGRKLTNGEEFWEVKELEVFKIKY